MKIEILEAVAVLCLEEPRPLIEDVIAKLFEVAAKRPPTDEKYFVTTWNEERQLYTRRITFRSASQVRILSLVSPRP